MRVVLMVNDNLKLMEKLQADGIHVGQSDTAVNVCRKKIGPNKIIGLSVSNAQQILKAQTTTADYLGVGAVNSTLSKTNAEIFNDYYVLKTCLLPFVFIGGLDAYNIKKLSKYAPEGYAFVSFLLKNPTAIKTLAV